jgi:4'-phosphopantetheinyl transferase EntD
MEGRTHPMGPVATLNSAALTGRDCLECFSDSERQQILGTRNGPRRRERVAGRLAAKFLFLNQYRGDQCSVLPPLVHLTPAHLDRFTASEYRSAEVFRSEKVRAGLPQIWWSGGDPGGNAGQSVAITHTHGLACAFLGTEEAISVDTDREAISVDMERSEPRTAAFYTGNFTAQERNWAADVLARLSLNLPWTFTFLWTAKECLLKTPWFRDLSIADLPSMDVRVTSGEEQLVYPHSAREFLAGFVFLQAEVADRSRRVHVNLAVSGRQDLVLTAVTAAQRRIA